MSELVTRDSSYATLQQRILSPLVQTHLAMACAKTVTPERMARVALTELRRTPKLLDCTPESFLGALMECAQLGLEPGPMGLAYIIPYGREAQFQIGYKGVLNLVWRSEQIAGVQSEVVYEGDEFEYANGIPPVLRHVPAAKRDPDAMPTHAYCAIATVRGGWIFRVMTYEEIERIRGTYSKAKKADSPWVTSWDEMACKTAIKRAAKRAPVSAEATRAIALDDLQERGVSQGLAANIEFPAVPESASVPDADENADD